MNTITLDTYRLDLRDNIVIIASCADQAQHLYRKLDSIGATSLTDSIYAVNEKRCSLQEVEAALANEILDGEFVTLLFSLNGKLAGKLLGNNLTPNCEGVRPE